MLSTKLAVGRLSGRLYHFSCASLATKKGKAPNPRKTKPVTDDQGNLIIPPALLLPTSSPHVFVAKIAAESYGFDPDSFTIVIHRHRQFKRMEPAEFGGQQHPSPEDTTPRFAFLGRSNVGKSSLLNALMKQSLAVTSKQPGRTQKVHYYGWVASENTHNSMERLHAYFVDLPGYGYAVGPDDAVQEWQRRTQQFLLRAPLTRLFLLQDARVGPQAFDQTVQGWLEEANIPFTIVLTKSDGARRMADIIKHVNQICMRYHHRQQIDDTLSQSPLVHVTSAKLGTGLDELWSAIESELSL
jgi:GTP-binding protein